MPARADFRYTNFSGDRGCPHFTYTDFFSWRYRRSLATHTFSGCRHRRILPKQTFWGCRHRRSCILGTQTFRVAGVLHLTYTHFRGDSYVNLRKSMSILKKYPFPKNSEIKCQCSCSSTFDSDWANRSLCLTLRFFCR